MTVSSPKFCRCGDVMLPSYDRRGTVIEAWVCKGCGANVVAGVAHVKPPPARSMRGQRPNDVLPGLGRLPAQGKQGVPIDHESRGSHLEVMLEAQLKQAKCGGFLREYQFAKPRRWRFDFCWPHLKLAVEIEGGTWNPRIKSRHTSVQGFQDDVVKYNHSAIQGWCVLRYTSKDVTRGNAAQEIAQVVAQKARDNGRATDA